MFIRVLILTLLATGLTACGGGAATTPTTTNPTPAPAPAPTSNQMKTARNALLSAYSPITYTNLGAIQTSGAATYDGYIWGDLLNTTDAVTDAVLGEMTLAVAFNNDRVVVSGDAFNFRDAQDAAMDGTLTFSGGTLDRNGDPTVDATFTLTANGTLVDAQNRSLVFGAELEGDFLGSTYQAIGGDALGRVTYNGITQNFNGDFIAER